jgi:hypothetical protein
MGRKKHPPKHLRKLGSPGTEIARYSGAIEGEMVILPMQRQKLKVPAYGGCPIKLNPVYGSF